MTEHAFLLEPGTWLGEGKITFTASPESIVFYTKWQIGPTEDEGIPCFQEVEMQGADDKVTNRFTIANVENNKFTIKLENEGIGLATGQGVIDGESIAWEFREKEGFQGFEVYNLQENGDYTFHAEYCSAEQFRTIIDGLIWKK